MIDPVELTAWATVGLALVTLLLVVATAWYLRQQNERAKTTYSVDLFVRLRDRVIGPEGAGVERRVGALLLHLKDRELSSRDVEYSPDLARYLNDYDWVGRFVKEGLIDEKFALATYGRGLLVLYEDLKPYMEKEREVRNYTQNWEYVDWLYARFRKLDRAELDETIKQHNINRWIDLRTRLTGDVEIDVESLLPPSTPSTTLSTSPATSSPSPHRREPQTGFLEWLRDLICPGR